MNPNECQVLSLKSIAEGNARLPPLPLIKRLNRFVRRQLSLKQVQSIHRCTDGINAFVSGLRGRKYVPVESVINVQIKPLKEGDLVRVRWKEEIVATLDRRCRLKGCSFANEMEPYCGTVRRVLKPVQQFVDERDQRLKKCKGLVLLEGVMCEGVPAFGRCDRSCFFFWREEWLEKIK